MNLRHGADDHGTVRHNIWAALGAFYLGTRGGVTIAIRRCSVLDVEVRVGEYCVRDGYIICNATVLDEWPLS